MARPSSVLHQLKCFLGFTCRVKLARVRAAKPPCAQLFDTNDFCGIMGFYGGAHMRRTNSAAPLNLFKRAICHLLTFRWRWFMNVYLRRAGGRVCADVWVLLFFLYSTTSLLPCFLQPSTFFPSNRSNCSVSMRQFFAAAASISPCLPASLRAYRDLPLGSYIWLVSTWPTAPHVISAAFHSQAHLRRRALNIYSHWQTNRKGGGGGVGAMGRRATQVKDCTQAPTLTVILSSRGLGRCLAVDEFKRRHMKVLGRGEMAIVWSTYKWINLPANVEYLPDPQSP